METSEAQPKMSSLQHAARIWSPYKELYHTVESAILRKQPDAIQDLEVCLRKHKPNFISLLKNSAKSSLHRNEVTKADVQGLTVQGQQTPQILSQQFIQECLIISDLFDLNEYAAVELLMAGENQQPYFPGLTRGLVAVVLYYDGRVSLVNALRALIQSRDGRTWSLGLPEDLACLATKFTEQLMSEGLTNRILEVLTEMNITKEVDKLQKERALGHSKHRKQVLDKMKEVQLSLAECLFCWCAQTPMNKDNTLALLKHLHTVEGTNADGTLDHVTVCLLMALLYNIDVRVLEQEDSEDIGQLLPIISDDRYIPEVHREIVSMRQWANPGLKSVVQFAWAVTLRTLPQHINNPAFNEYLEQDESVIDQAIQDNVFFFLYNSVVGSESFFKEKFFVTQVHNILTDFIVQMPLKVKELRNSGDETARIIVANIQEGLEPPTHLPRYFEHLLILIGDLYGKDPLGLELALEFWCPPETTQQATVGGFANVYNYRPPQRQISLYKFVRLAGDLLPPPLYIPYIQMLTGLANGQQCAHHCYNLLKSNGQSAGGHASAVSWDHFFLSMNQYYTNLRQESQPDMSHIYSRHHPRGITPQELDGLVCVLKLTQKIAQHDQFARIALCENQQWLPLVVLLGLVGCSVPTPLKAELMVTLSTLAKSPEIAAHLWSSIEVSQILPTISTSNVHPQTGGIQVELDEVEARNEDFPMTLAFLDMINTLTENPIPAGLGAGYRAPGFQPYLDFLRESVFLKFNTRAYKRPEQKWEIASSVLEIFYKLLNNHDIQLDDFVDQQVELPNEGVALLNKPPGHSLMVHMLNDSQLLRMVLFIIDEATKILSKYLDFPGKNHLEKASLLCLNMIQVTLEKQDAFLNGLRESGATLLVSHMDKLLMGINPRSGKADHLVNIARYVVHNSSLPEHSLSAVKVLCYVTQSPLVQPKIVGLFTATEDLAVELLSGFVECMECDEPEELEVEDDLTDEDPSVAHIRNLTRQTIMKLLLQTLDQPAPNLAHFLLGYELRKPASKTNLQDPGVLDSPRTCLHSALTILDRGVDTRTGPACLQETPKLADLSYHLVYKLCANRETSTPTMRYLRTAHDFLFRHLQHVPFQLPDSGRNSLQTDSLSLSQQSWLLKSVAIELKLTAANRQRSHTQRILNLLLDDNPQAQQKAPDGVYEPEFSQYENDFSMYTSGIQAQQTLVGGQAPRKILSILQAIDFIQDYPPPLELEFFNQGLIEQAITSVEQRAIVVQADVKTLHKMLMNEVNNLQGAATGQRPLVVKEVEDICRNVLERNQFRETVHTKKQAFDAWRQVLEIILTACPSDLLQGEARQNILFEVLQDLLMKVSKDDVVPELSALVAGVILTLMANLRQCFMQEQSESGEWAQNSQYISILDRTSAGTSGQKTGYGGMTGSRTLYSSSLQVVLRGLVEYLMKTSSNTQRVRANLYGALLYFLQISQKPNTPISDTQSHGVGAKLTSVDSEYDKLSAENLATISSYGDNLMEVICRDACDGHDVGRMLSMACLDAVLSVDLPGDWLTFMTSKGYLQHIIGSLLQEDEQLHHMLQPNPEPLRALYLFESKMGMLTRVAQSATGAHTLLQCGLMARLAECNIFDVRPEVDRHTESFIPSVLSRYRQQILFPVLKLCLAVLTSLGVENRQAAYKVLQFIVAHIDVFTSILREKQPGLNVESLRELALTTAVVGRAALDDLDSDTLAGDTAAIEFRGHVTRLQRQMIALLPRFCLTEKMEKQVRNLELAGGAEGSDTRLHIQVALVEISANVVAFCRTIISKAGTGSQLFRILFGPSLAEAMSRDLSSLEELQTSVSLASHPHNLGLVVYILRQATDHFLTVFDDHKNNQRKLGNVVDLSSEELKELSGVDGGEKMSAQQRQALARHRLLNILAYNTQQMQLYSYMIENCLYILWRHLDFYLVHCVPAEASASLYRTHQRKSQLRRLQDPNSSLSFAEDEELKELQSGVSREDLELLKHDAVHCINETVFKKLHEIEQCYTKDRNRYGFMEALVRRIKRLLTLHTGLP